MKLSATILATLLAGCESAYMTGPAQPVEPPQLETVEVAPGPDQVEQVEQPIEFAKPPPGFAPAPVQVTPVKRVPKQPKIIDPYPCPACGMG